MRYRCDNDKSFKDKKKGCTNFEVESGCKKSDKRMPDPAMKNWIPDIQLDNYIFFLSITDLDSIPRVSETRKLVFENQIRIND